jgi:sortase A
VAVLDPVEEPILTIVTCYPFYWVGSAPERFIVRAKQVGRAGLDDAAEE